MESPQAATNLHSKGENATSSFDIGWQPHNSIHSTMFTSFAPLLLAFATVVHGHGNLVSPEPTWKSGVNDITQFCGTIDGPKVLPGDQYNTSPQANTAAFTSHFKASSYSSLKALVVANPGACGTCGNTLASGTPRAFPSDGFVRWHHGSGEGFTSSHEGPCEVWCDGNLAFQDDNCSRNLPSGDMKVDASKCRGAKQLTIYWLALQSPAWQIYINCVPLSGGGAPSPPSSGPSPSPTTRPSPSPSSSSKPSTSKPPTNPSSKPPTPSTSGPSQGGDVAVYQQCGGSSYNGPTQCQSGLTCKSWSQWYSQCIPQDSARRL
ncbi:hypothetical protein LEN26_003101 [Aphanomyces euteiches]|nr:hypothetical protein LEN26_003101 [Aphanomyces euteiches]